MIIFYYILFIIILLLSVTTVISENEETCKIIPHCDRCPNNKTCSICEEGYKLDIDQTKCHDGRNELTVFKKNNNTKNDKIKDPFKKINPPLDLDLKDEEYKSIFIYRILLITGTIALIFLFLRWLIYARKKKKVGYIYEENPDEKSKVVYIQ